MTRLRMWFLRRALNKMIAAEFKKADAQLRWHEVWTRG